MRNDPIKISLNAHFRDKEGAREQDEREREIRKFYDFAALVPFVIFRSRFCFNKTLTSVRFECAEQSSGTDGIV